MTGVFNLGKDTDVIRSTWVRVENGPWAAKMGAGRAARDATAGSRQEMTVMVACTG